MDATMNKPIWDKCQCCRLPSINRICDDCAQLYAKFRAEGDSHGEAMARLKGKQR
jgi:hypothetical protein